MIDKNYTNKTKVESVYWSTSAFELKVTSFVLWEKYNAAGVMSDADLYKYDVPSSFYFRGTLARTIGLNCGLSIELFLKACIIERLGQLPKDLMTHKLEKLSEEAGVIFSAEQKMLLSILTEYIFWAGKYPSGKGENSVEELILQMESAGVENPECYSSLPCTFEQYIELWNKILYHYSGIGGFGEVNAEGEYIKPFKKGNVWKVVLEEQENNRSILINYAENLNLPEAFILAELKNSERTLLNGVHIQRFYAAEM